MRKYLLLICIVCLCFTACMPTTMKEKQQNNADKNQITYTKIDDLDFSSGHIEGVLKENFYLDADVTIDVPTECGIYELSKKNLDSTQEDYLNQFVSLINEFYGEDQAVVDKGDAHLTGQLPNCDYDGNSGYFSKTSYNDVNKLHGKIKIIENFFYEYGFEYDKELIDGYVKKFLDTFKEVIPNGIDEEYICIHFNDEYWKALVDEYGEEALKNIMDMPEKEFYGVILYPEIENDIFLKTFQPKAYTPLEGEILDEVSYYDEWKSIFTHNRQYLELIISEEGEVLSFRFGDYFKIEDKINSYEIIDAKTALKFFYKEYENILLDDDVIVKSISLEYEVVLEDKLSENGYRNAYLCPVWRIRYNSEYPHMGLVELDYSISAITGTVVRK